MLYLKELLAWTSLKNSVLLCEKFMQLNENEQKVYKLVSSINKKNKVKDLSLVYNYAYSLKVTDDSIQKILLLASW